MTTPQLPSNADVARFGADVAALYEARRQLAQKMLQIQNRLASGFSKPLEESLTELKKADMRLICQITDQLS